jgi:hypothetical protein
VTINKRDLDNLKTLLIEKSITYGKLSNKNIVDKLKLNGAIEIKRTAKRKIIHLKKKLNIFNFLQNIGYKIDSVEDIDNYLQEIDNAPRDTIQKWHNDTKTKKSDSMKGLYLSSLKEIDIKLNDKIITILPNNGLGYFLFHTEKIEVSKNITIVGIENYQVVWFSQKYKDFFTDGNFLFVYINGYMLQWIENLPNNYIHFGDFDLAGINIYLNKVVPRLKKSQKYSIMIPNGIEKLIKENGCRKIFQQQIRYKDLSISDASCL